VSAAPAIDRLCRHPCTLLVRTQDGPPDLYGNPTWQEAQVQTVCELQQVGSREELDGAVQITTWRVWLPPGAPVRGWNALDVTAGPHVGRYELEGDAAPVAPPTGDAVHHVEASVRRTV
jgi:hypothetical protein